MSLQAEVALRLNTDFEAALLRMDRGNPMSLVEQREMIVRGRDSSRYIMTMLGRHPRAVSSHESSHCPPRAPSPSVPSSVPSYSTPYMGAGPSHATPGNLTEHYTNIKCNIFACINLLLQDRTWEPDLLTLHQIPSWEPVTATTTLLSI